MPANVKNCISNFKCFFLNFVDGFVSVLSGFRVF